MSSYHLYLMFSLMVIAMPVCGQTKPRHLPLFLYVISPHLLHAYADPSCLRRPLVVRWSVHGGELWRGHAANSVVWADEREMSCTFGPFRPPREVANYNFDGT